MYATNHFETAILNSMRGTTLAAPSTLYLALFLTNPTDTGTDGIELSYEGYKRMEITFSTPSRETGGVTIQNDRQITFPTASASSGTVTHIGVMDSQTGGNMWAYGELSDPLNVMANVAPVFLPGTVKYSLSGNMTSAYKTKYLEVLRGKSISGFTLHIALYHNDPENGGSELSGANYARVPLTMNAPTEAESGQMQLTNSTESAFVPPTTNWGSWNYFYYLGHCRF